MKSSLKITILTLIISILSVVQISAVRAQVPSSIDGMEISVSPANPAPGQHVSIKVESYVTDLNAAAIVWIVDGKNYAKGTGMQTLEVSAPQIGKSLTIVAVIMTTEGKEVKKSVTIKSGGVELVWESGGYVPPFYKGKATFAYENPIRITAMPHLAGANGSELDPRSLVYKWKKNSKVVQDQSGYGKQTLSIQEDIPTPFDIEVEVGTSNGSEKGEASINLEPGDPSISFYEEDPLYGVLYNKAILNKISLTNPELSIRAVPYTFNTKGLKYLWSINNLEKPDLSTNQSVTLRPKGDATGNSDLSLEIRNMNDILQGAKNAIGVSFSKKTSDSNLKF